MSLREQFKKETGKKLHFTPRKTNIKDYVEWLEQKLSLPKESDAVKFGEWLLNSELGVYTFSSGDRKFYTPATVRKFGKCEFYTTEEAYKLFKAEEKEKK